MSTESNTGKEIFFYDQAAVSSGPMQADVVDTTENNKVTIFCDQEFVIFFKSGDLEKYILSPPGSRMLSSPANDDETLHEVVITFITNPPPQGLDYSVITANGVLDPRFVPPHEGEKN